MSFETFDSRHRMLIYGKNRRSLIASMCMVDYRRSLIASMCVRKHLSKFNIASHAEQHKHMCVYMYICGQGSSTPRGQGPRLIFSAAVKDRYHLYARRLGGSFLWRSRISNIRIAVNDRQRSKIANIRIVVNDCQHSCLVHYIFSSPWPFCAKVIADVHA